MHKLQNVLLVKAVMVVCRTAMESRGDRGEKMLTLVTEWKLLAVAKENLVAFDHKNVYKYPRFYSRSAGAYSRWNRLDMKEF